MEQEIDLTPITPQGYIYQDMCKHPFFDMDLEDEEEEETDGNT